VELPRFQVNTIANTPFDNVVLIDLNPQGCQVFSLKQPSATELDHDFLWRASQYLPERGRIGIFNRSHYEEVLIIRVHPEILYSQRLPDELLDENTIWKERYRPIVDLENHLHRNGTRIIKFSRICQRRSKASAFLTHKRSGEKLEIQCCRHLRKKMLEAVHAGL
jgi:polyphosphate kinase 2 (PPK2 family)